MKGLSLFFIILFTLTLLAETHLSDDIGGKTFEPSGNPHIVDQEVVVSKNTKIVIKAGCIFLFNSFTGINVYGSMIVEGTEDKPVIFSSINDANHNPKAEQLPNAFDWNGIYVAESASDIKFRNFKLMYSVFGIKSKKDDITLQNGYFKQNGQFHFTINDNILYVQDNISYSYNVEEEDIVEKKQQKVETSDTVEKPVKKKEGNRGRKVAAISIMSAGAASGITAIITGIMAIQYKDKSENAETPEDFDKYNDKFNSMRTTAIITGALCGVSLSISLFLLIKKDKSTMTKKVSLNIVGGKDRIGIGIVKYY